jgi:hypothetical protein
MMLVYVRMQRGFIQVTEIEHTSRKHVLIQKFDQQKLHGKLKEARRTLKLYYYGGKAAWCIFWLEAFYI